MIQMNTMIASPNYTQIPNVIFDYWMSRLSPGSFKILICMCRKIFGWHKTSDTISKNQLIKVSGMSKNSIQTAIEELEKCGLILKFQHQNEYGHQPNTYSLNIQKPLDEIYQEVPVGDQNLGGGRSKTDLGVGQDLTQGVGQNLTPQKKDSTKERLTKEITPLKPPHPKPKEKEPAKAGEEREKPSLQIFSPEVSLISDDMITALKEAKPTYKEPKVLTQLLHEIDKMIRLDSRDPKLICLVFRWAVSDSFWADKMFKPNPAKYLREKFDQLEMKMNVKPAPKERKFAPCSDDNKAREKMKNWGRK